MKHFHYSDNAARVELAQYNQWVVSKRTYRNGKVDKPPLRVNPNNETRLIPASHSDPTHWTTWKEACRIVCTHGSAEAAGFVFSDADPYSGADFDGCRDPKTGAIEEWAQTWIDRLNSYTEISVSETGVKVWVRGKLPKALIHKLGDHKGIEIYSRQRYFWMTGRRLTGTPETINEAQAVLDAMVAELDPPKPAPAPKPAKPIATVKCVNTTHTLGTSPIADLKRTIDLDAYLESQGYTLRYARGTSHYYRAPEREGRTHTITLVTSPSTRGPGRIFYSYSPNGPLGNSTYPRGGDILNAIEAYEGESAVAALLPEKKGTDTNRTLDAPYTDDQKAAWRAQKNAQNAAAATELHARIRTQIDTDDRLIPCDRAVLGVMVDWMEAHHATACTLGRASIARLSGYSLGAVKRAVMHLEELGYFESSGDGGRPIDTARRNFSRGSCFATQNTCVSNDDPRIDISSDLNLDPVFASERAPGGEPDSLDTWAWQADCHGADELNALDSDYIEADLVANLPQGTQPADRMAQVEAIEAMTDDELRAWMAGMACKSQTVRPAEPAAEGVVNLTTPNPAESDDTPGASYAPALDWTASNKRFLEAPDPRAVPSWLRQLGDIGPMVRKIEVDEPQTVQILDTFPDPDPLVRCPPSDPVKQQRYYSLLGASKKATNEAQRRKLALLAYGMEEWRPFGDAPRLTSPPATALFAAQRIA